MPPLTIGIDARAAAEVPAGRGRVTRELIRALPAVAGDHRLRLYARERWQPAPVPDEAWSLSATRDPLWALSVGRRARRECDAFLGTNTYLAAAFAGAGSVPLVHDMVVFERGANVPRASHAERATLGPALRRAAAVICVSGATRNDLTARFPVATPKAHVVHLGCEERFLRAEPRDVARGLGIKRPFVLFIGTLEPRKNLRRLVEAFQGLPSELSHTFELVIAGMPGWDRAAAALAEGGEERHVRVVGFVPDEDLPSLYAEATVFAFPSLREGFGLPVLEAMAAGTPVLTSDRSSMPEVAGDAASYVDPEDVESLRAGLARLLSDAPLRRSLAHRGQSRAREFTWERAARATLAILESAAATSRGRT